MATPNNTDAIDVAQLLYAAEKERDYTAEVAKTAADLITAREQTSNKTTNITSSSTDTQYPSAKAVYALMGKMSFEINDNGHLILTMP